jgi:predicted transcriptional regulator of viral defense system
MGVITERNKELFEVAQAQQGLFTAKQAEAIGYLGKNHAYHVKAGHWIREERGIYRLTLFPKSSDEQKVIYSLWSQNREGIVQGVYSHETALTHYELSDMNPTKLHMTVPKSFRRNSKIPKVLKLHFANLTKDMFIESRGYFVTKPARTISDVIQSDWIPMDIARQAIQEAIQKGLVHKWELESIIAHIKVTDETRKQLTQILKAVGK